MEEQTDFRLEYSSVSLFSKYKRVETQIGNIILKNHVSIVFVVLTDKLYCLSW